jgi:hypothetical protein
VVLGFSTDGSKSSASVSSRLFFTRKAVALAVDILFALISAIYGFPAKDD